MRQIPWVQQSPEKFEELDAVRDHAQSGEGACCNCRVLNLVSTCRGVLCFSSVPCPLVVAVVFHVRNSWAHSVSAEEIRVFQACIVVKTKSGGMF